ncbi:hypothetical protein D3C73_988960 [compost metagenome]
MRSEMEPHIGDIKNDAAEYTDNNKALWNFAPAPITTSGKIGIMIPKPINIVVRSSIMMPICLFMLPYPPLQTFPTIVSQLFYQWK